MDNDDNRSLDGAADLTPPPPPPPPASRRRSLLGRRGATAALAGGLVAGGIAGGYMITQAATPAPSASASPSTGAPGDTDHRGAGGFAGAGPAAHIQDLQQAAAAIGIAESQLQTELAAGKTIAAIATAHGADVAKVIATLVTDENAEIDAAVSSGQLTQAQAAQMKNGTQQRVTDLVNGSGAARGGPGGRRGPGGPSGEDQQVVATAIGISVTQLQTEQAAGKTIAAIAAGHNVTAAPVITAWVASENAEIDQRVSSGQLTAAQAAQMKATTAQRVTDEVNGTEPAGGHGGPPFGAPSGSSPTS